MYFKKPFKNWFVFAWLDREIAYFLSFLGYIALVSHNYILGWLCGKA